MKSLIPANCLVIFAVLIFIGKPTCSLLAQAGLMQKILKSQQQNQHVESDPTRKVKVLYENGESDSIAINKVKLINNKSALIGLGNSVSTVQTESGTSGFNDLLRLNKDSAVLKSIPELYVNHESAINKHKIYQILFTSQSPLQYDFEKSAFSGRISFFLAEESADPSTVNAPISEPLELEVNSTDIGTLNPRHLRVAHLYFPSSDIELVADHVQDSAMIMILTRSNPAGYKTYIKVKPALEIASNRKEMEGFGIQEIPLTVRYVGSNSSSAVKVSLTAEKGSLTPHTLDLKYNEPAIVMLRSEGVGPSMISAQSARHKANNYTITYLFPWVFLIASIVGGLLGAILKFYSHTVEKKFSFKPLLVGVLMGIIGAVAYYALSINLLELELTTNSTFNEFAVFGLSALFAFFGIKRKVETTPGG